MLFEARPVFGPSNPCWDWYPCDLLRVAVSQAACSIAFRFHLVGERTDAAKAYEKATGSIYLSREGEEESEVDDLW